MGRSAYPQTIAHMRPVEFRRRHQIASVRRAAPSAGRGGRPAAAVTRSPEGPWSEPRGVVDRVKWPVVFDPREDRVVEDRVECGEVGAYP